MVPVPSPNKGPAVNAGYDPNTPQASGVGMRQPFAKAAKVTTLIGPTSSVAVSTANPVIPLKVPTFGYLKRLLLLVTCTTAGNAAATAFNADAPWNIFRNVLFKDVNGTPIVNLSGYQLFLVQKYGGYELFRPEASTLTFSTTTGAGATGGSFTLVHEIPICFGRDGLGALANMDASQQYQLDLTLGNTADLYSVAPTNPGTVSIQLIAECFANPPQVDQFGNTNEVQPPGFGTAQYWSQTVFNLNTGENTIQLTRLGNTIRNHLLVWRTGAGARSETVLPTGSITWEWDAGIRFQETVLARRYISYRNDGFDNDTGVMVYQYTTDPEGLPLAEYGDQWWQTLGSTRLIIRTTPALTGTLEVITNDAVIVGRPVSPS